MLKPDINDPAWIAQRETIWKPIEKSLSGEFSKKELRVAREIFFTGDYDLSKKDHEAFFDATGEAWEFAFYPEQTVQSWTNYFTKTLPERYRHRSYNLVRWIPRFAGFDVEYERFGWDVVTELELHHFLLGDSYIPGEISLLGYTSRNAYAPDHVVLDWNRPILRWYCNRIGSDNKWIHLKKYWLSALPYLDKKFINKHEELMGLQDRQVVMSFQKLLYQTFHFDQDRFVKEARKDNRGLKDVPKEDTTRYDFANSLSADLEAIAGPIELVELINAAKNPKFKPVKL